MSKGLLVAVDGSENALRAVQYAIKLANECGRRIHLVTAYEAPRLYGEIAVYVSRDRMAELQRQSAEIALEGAEQRLREAAVPYTREILSGPVAAVIAGRADELGCDSIVIDGDRQPAHGIGINEDHPSCARAGDAREVSAASRFACLTTRTSVFSSERIRSAVLQNRGLLLDGSSRPLDMQPAENVVRFSRGREHSRERRESSTRGH
jgi:nucleotide-binding universal stress UspA family protein